jgi:hypothetical protein
MSLVRFVLLSVILLCAATAFANPSKQNACPADLLQRAEQGDHNVQCYLGHMYLSGKGVEQDFARAQYWYQKVVEQQGADAKIVAHANFVLGMLYSSGKGVKQDYREALQCFQNAAKQGYTDAHINIGLLYAKGLGVKQDYQKALYWWELAAKKGHPTAPIYVLKLKKRMHVKG